MAASKPLIAGSHAILPPRGIKLDKATLPDRMRIGLASKSWRYHWHNADLGGPYDPYGIWGRPRFDKQVEFHDMPHKFRAFVGGVGSGKSQAAGAETVRYAMEHPGATIIVAAPTYKMLTQATKPALMRILRREAIASENKQDGIMTLTNGTVIWFRSTDNPETIRGIDAAAFVLDEGAYTSGRAWDILVGRLRQVGYPHRAWVTTTPNGYSWLYDRFANPETATEEYGWVQVSSRDNPYTDEGFITSLETTYAGAFAKQEIEGEFVMMEGLVYPGFSWDKHVGSFREKDFNEHLYFVDFGFTNPAVVLVAGLDSDRRAYILEEWFETGRTDEEQGEAIRYLQQRYGRGDVVCDPAEPGIIEKFRRKGLNAFKADNSKMQGIQEVTSRLADAKDGRPRLFIDESCVNLLREMRSYHYPEGKDGKPVKEEPVKVDDHALDALRYGMMHLRAPATWGMLQNSDLDMVI